jgi:hypothetical protein
MANLKSESAGHTIPLCHHTRVGRSRDADIRINDRRISSDHAVIAWNKGLWEVKDLGSRNGTVVDGRRVEPGSRVILRTGSSLRFGSPDLEWVLESDDEPDVVAVDMEEGTIVEGEHGLLQWDNKYLLFTENGVDYWFEHEGERQAIADRHVVEISGRRWRISIPPPDENDHTVTADGVLLSRDVKLQFQVSPDEEHVQVSIWAPGVHRELRGRSFDYMLLALARARISDAASGTLPPEEQGWVYADELADSLGMDVSHVNVDIYRARRRFASAGIQGADEMLERRNQTRALRLGCGSVEIV